MTKTTKPSLPRTLSKADFEAIAERCFQSASQTIAAGKPIPSTLLLGRMHDGKAEIGRVLFVPIEDSDHKIVLTALMEALVQEPDIDFAVHVTEAWFLANPTELPTRSIAKHPKRLEAVTFNIMSKDCQTVVINMLHRKPNRLERGAVDFTRELRGLMARDKPPAN